MCKSEAQEYSPSREGRYRENMESERFEYFPVSANSLEQPDTVEL